MLRIQETIDKYGYIKARQYFLQYFEDAYANPEKMEDWLSLFPNHYSAPLPDYQKDLLTLIPTSERLAFGAPRGSGKSTLVNIGVCAYYSLYNISPFSLIVSDTLTQAKLQLDSFKEELTSNPFIQWLFGDVQGRNWGSEMCIIKTKYGESLVTARGAGQKIRGLKFKNHRPHLVIIDDLENDEAVESFERRDKLEHWFRYNLLRGLSKDWNKVIYVGTILHENSLLNRILKQEEEIFFGWTTRVYKAIREDGTSFWETRFPLTYLMDVRDNPQHPDYAGSIVFAQEFQSEPRSEKDQIIKRSWIQTYSLQSKFQSQKELDEWLHTCRIISGVDPAVSTDELKKSSFFCASALAIDKEGHIWHLETMRGKFTIDKQIENLLTFYKKWNVDIMGVESVAYQQVLAFLLRQKGAELGIYPQIKELHTDKDKVRRVVATSSKWEGGFIHLNTDCSETAHLIEEAVTFPAEPNDAIDSVTLGLEAIKKPKSRAFKRKPKQFR